MQLIPITFPGTEEVGLIRSIGDFVRSFLFTKSFGLAFCAVMAWSPDANGQRGVLSSQHTRKPSRAPAIKTRNETKSMRSNDAACHATHQPSARAMISANLSKRGRIHVRTEADLGSPLPYPPKLKYKTVIVGKTSKCRLTKR